MVMEVEKHRIKRGTARADGLMFWQYEGSGKERWITKEKYAEKSLRHADTMRRCRKNNPELYRNIERKSHSKNAAERRQKVRTWVNSKIGRDWWVKYYSENKDKRSERAKKWRADNPETASATMKRYRANNADAIRAKARERSRAYPERHRAFNAMRHAAKMGATPEGCCASSIAVVYAWAKRLSRCIGIPYDVDHITPLSAGGEHSARNLQPLPASINRRKHARRLSCVPSCYRTDGFSIQKEA